MVNGYIKSIYNIHIYIYIVIERRTAIRFQSLFAGKHKVSYNYTLQYQGIYIFIYLGTNVYSFLNILHITI